MKTLLLMRPIKTSIAESQARACCDGLRYVLQQSLIDGRPADRVLSGWLRTNRQFGSRDRRLISDIIFAAFRWWGWLRECLPPDLRNAGSCGVVSGRRNTSGTRDAADGDGLFAAMSPAECGSILLWAALLDDQPVPEVAANWAAWCRADWHALREAAASGIPNGLADKAVWLKKRGFTPAEAVQINNLIPAWALPLMPHPDTDKLLTWLQQRPPLWLRVQGTSVRQLIRELEQEGITAEMYSRLRGAVAVRNTRINLFSLAAFRRGGFEVQDLASQTVGHVCAPKAGERWWDACAGAGGKSLHLAQLMQGRGTVIATDIRDYKLNDLRKRARRAGFSNISGKPWDGKPVRRKSATFDGVLVDAPCTCSGTWRRNPDARWTTALADVEELAGIQEQLLKNAASGVRPGGVLVYATCSMFERENSQVVRRFIEAMSGFCLEPFASPFTGEMTDGTLQVWPWDGDCDTMFVARLRRQAGTGAGQAKADVSAPPA